MKSSTRHQLTHRFARQAEFAAGYAPLTGRLFAIVGGWLADEGDPLASWLVEVSQGRRPLDVTLLLAAGLHAAVLGGHAAAGELAAYYPTAGGRRPLDDDLEAYLRQAVVDLQPELKRAIQAWQVQTNETGRGSAWLLPVARSGWPEIDLVDLGASAGLNLAADRRLFQYRASADGREIGRLGKAADVQFAVSVHGYDGRWDDLARHPLPRLVNRIGCDQNPFPLDSPNSQLQLMSYVWADHPQRLQRLREGIAARQQLDIRLEQAALPADLPGFLDNLPSSGRPLVLYNTVITPYFPDEVGRMSHIIATWAQRQPRPIVWLQWEPANPARDETTLAWTADRWQNGRHDHQLLGWVHPHGLKIDLISDN